MTICLQLDHVNYSYGAAKIRVLSDVNADFESGKMYAITGPSGAGKSTLLSLLAGLDAPSDGVVRFEGKDIATTGYSKHRREHVSLVFQDHNLIDYLTAKENVILGGRKNPEEFLEKVNIPKEDWNRSVLQLSGGQQQRVAIARALASEAKVLLADEPTGNLDPTNSWEIMKLLEEANDRGTTVLVVTHNQEIVNEMKKRVVTMKKGVIVSDEKKGGYNNEN